MYKQKAVEGDAEGVTDKDATTLTDPLHSSDGDYVSNKKNAISCSNGVKVERFLVRLHNKDRFLSVIVMQMGLKVHVSVIDRCCQIKSEMKYV